MNLITELCQLINEICQENNKYYILDKCLSELQRAMSYNQLKYVITFQGRQISELFIKVK